MSILLCVAPAFMQVGKNSSAARNAVGTPFAKRVTISLMNSKPEITEALEAGAAKFGREFNVKVQVYETASPGDTLAQKYAAGDAPTIGIMDIANVRDLYAEKLSDLSDQKWVSIGGKTLGAVMNGKVYGMPLTIEGMCLLYNKTAIEKIIRRKFNAVDYTSLKKFTRC